MAASTISITVRSNFSPTVTFDPTKKDTSPIRNGILNILKPSLDINLPVVGNEHYAPWGEPTGWGLVAVYAVIGLALYGAFRLLK